MSGPAGTRSASPAFRRGTRYLLSVLGLGLLAFMLAKIGPSVLLRYLVRFGPWFLAITAIGLAWLFLQAWAWSLVQAAHFRPVPLAALFRTKIISDSLNTLLPSANVGGDAARAFLIRRHAPLKEGFPGVLVDKTLEAFGAALFLAAGFGLGLAFLRLPRWLTAAAVVCLLISAAGLGLLIVVLRKGVLWTLRGAAKVVPPVRRFIAGREPHLRELDANLCLAQDWLSPRTAAAVGLHFAARVLGAFEVYVIGKVLGAGVSVLQALFLSTGVTIVNTAFFVVPGQFGVMETAHALVLQSLGFPAALGLSIGLIRRVRRLITTGLGLVLYAAQRSPAAGPGAH